MFCFVIKDECKQLECIGWNEDNNYCKLTKFLETYITKNEITQKSEKEINEIRKEIELTRLESEKVCLELDNKRLQSERDYNSRKSTPEISQTPKEIILPPEEELAEELLELVKDNPHAEQGYFNHRTVYNFWISKGVDMRFGVPQDLRIKTDKVEMLVKKSLENTRNKRLEEEKTKVTDIATECINWLRGQGVKGVITKTNVEMFLEEKELDILWETKNSIYRYANTMSKSK